MKHMHIYKKIKGDEVGQYNNKNQFNVFITCGYKETSNV